MNKEELVEAWFANKLSSEQEKELQVLLKTDSELKERFDFENDLKEVIIAEERREFKSRLKEIESSIIKRKRFRLPVKTLALAASFILLIGWAGYQFLFADKYQNLYETYYSDYPNTVYSITRGGEETGESLEREAFVAYEAEIYKTAIERFNQIDRPKRPNYLNFYLGLSYMGNKQYALSIKQFEQNIMSGGPFRAETLWYMSLALIKENRLQDAKHNLNQLLDLVGGFKKQEARELLKKLG